MSIQNRLLIIYTTIFAAAFILFALIVYMLPRNWILAEIDTDLEEIASRVQTGEPVSGPDDIYRLTVPEDLANFKTATVFMIVVDGNGEIVAQSTNLLGFDELLDPDGRSDERSYSLRRHDGSLLRVLTVPIVATDGRNRVIIGHLQVARLLDNYERFSRVLVLALLVGSAAVTGSVFLAVWITPTLFKPLEDIASVARQISRADDLSRRVPNAERPDEIGDLARALNQSLERLERLFRTQQRLLADVSHELRTPLTSLRGNLDLMVRMGEADPETFAVLQDELERMSRLVGDLMLLARVDVGGLPLVQEPVELDNLLFQVYRQATVLARSVRLTVTDVDQVSVLGDSDRLRQLLLNLVDNALKYTPAGGEVSLSLSKQAGWARLQVSDTGTGIPAEDLPHVFDRFYRVDKARNRGRGGSGLGLAIAKWIAQAHGGAIEVKSQLGEGTTFTITLPAYSTAPELPPPAPDLPEAEVDLEAVGANGDR